MKQILSTFILLLLVPSALSAQDLSYSQFYNNPVYLNPALAGCGEGRPRINFNSRLQNPALPNRFTTTTLSTDMYSEKLHGGLALQLTNFVSSRQVIIGNSLCVGYSFHHKLSDQFILSIGAQVGWHQNFLDWNKLTFGYPVDPVNGFVYNPLTISNGSIFDNGWGTNGFLDINSGIAIFSNNHSLGISVKHINRPQSAFIYQTEGLPILVLAYAGTKIEVGQQFIISPNALYSFQNGYQSITAGFNLQYKIFKIGLYARDKNALIFSAGIEKDRFRFQYSFDYGVSKLSNSSWSAHESSLMFRF